VGLVFAEDKHIVDIGMNRKFLSQLSSWLGLSLIEDTHVFPLGNMFWARVSAIQDIFHLSPADILQSEPLPYDGSFLHALERLTPYIAMKNGYEYVTVYDKISDW
jgi:lipopolysaccharide biosynthesis protein